MRARRGFGLRHGSLRTKSAFFRLDIAGRRAQVFAHLGDPGRIRRRIGFLELGNQRRFGAGVQLAARFNGILREITDRFAQDRVEVGHVSLR